jgi:hypothetical protein
MKSKISSPKLITGSLAVAALVCLPCVSGAASTSFLVNSALSSLTLQGEVAGLEFIPQSAGSMVDSWGGTLVGDVSGGVITFNGGSAITAILNPASPFQPQPIASYGGGVENYGVQAEGFVAFLGGFATVNGAWRNLSLNIAAGTVQNALASSGMTLNYNTGSRLDYYVASPGFTGPGQDNLSNNPLAPNTAAGTVGWDGETLTLPVAFTMFGDNGLVQYWSGTIVATAVPEPTSMALALLGLGLFAARRARTAAAQ